MNRVTKFFSIAAFSLLMLGLPAIASAQWGGYGNGGYGNGGYGNRGGYDNGSVIRSLKDKTREFQRHLDQDLDRSRYNGSRREDEINDIAREFRTAVNRINNNGRDYNDIRRAQDLARQMDRVIGRARISYNTQNLWQSIRYDLQRLGNGGYYDDRGGRNGGWNDRPSWWPF